MCRALQQYATELLLWLLYNDSKLHVKVVVAAQSSILPLVHFSCLSAAQPSSIFTHYTNSSACNW
jgi:hypothetical protein